MNAAVHGPSQGIPHPVRQSIRRKLLRWYDRHQRDLPWRRRAGDPYAQWVAEIMLQQTRVETVIPFYERFMKRFPSVESLARARHDTVLKHWEGLGYYRRILHLHDAVRLLAREKREIPKTSKALRQLSGVGAYTSAAIASIAFGEAVAAVDGNVARVVARLFGIDDDILASDGKKRIDHAADQLLSRGRPGDFNQAWMDLGSSVCTPKSPQCDICPMASECRAFATGRTDSLPVRDGNRKKPREMTLLAAAFRCNGKVLMRRRPKGGLWSGLWELPTAELDARTEKRDGGVSIHGAAGALIENVCGQHDLSMSESPSHAGTVHHKLTHLSLTIVVIMGIVRSDETPADRRDARWVAPSEIAKLSVSAAQRKALRAAFQGHS